MACLHQDTDDNTGYGLIALKHSLKEWRKQGAKAITDPEVRDAYEKELAFWEAQKEVKKKVNAILKNRIRDPDFEFPELTDEVMFGNNAYAQYYQLTEAEMLGDNPEASSAGMTMVGTGILTSWIEQDKSYSGPDMVSAVRKGEERSSVARGDGTMTMMFLHEASGTLEASVVEGFPSNNDEWQPASLEADDFIRKGSKPSIGVMGPLPPLTYGRETDL